MLSESYDSEHENSCIFSFLLHQSTTELYLGFDLSFLISDRKGSFHLLVIRRIENAGLHKISKNLVANPEGSINATQILISHQ